MNELPRHSAVANEAGFSVVSMTVMGAILGGWRKSNDS